MCVGKESDRESDIEPRSQGLRRPEEDLNRAMRANRNPIISKRTAKAPRNAGERIPYAAAREQRHSHKKMLRQGDSPHHEARESSSTTDPA